MNETLTKKFTNYSTLEFWIIGLSLTSGLILSILSWLDLCVEHCSANHEYRLFGLPFGPVGIAFFSVTLCIHFYSKRYEQLNRVIRWMIAAGLGAEAMFIIVQKYQIGHWCPVCLSIALSLAVAGLALMIDYGKQMRTTIKQRNHEEIMQKLKKAVSSISFFFLGFLLAFIGISKPNLAQAAAKEMKERIAFGNYGSPVEIYIVTDWFCPSCHNIESTLEEILPSIQNKASYYFVDFAIHSKSLNFSPYNLSFLINNKNHYLEARQMLLKLTDKTQSPTDVDIMAAAKEAGIKYNDLSYLDIKSGLDFFDTITKKYQLNSTPTIVISNNKTKKIIKLEGSDEISKDKILKAIDKLTK